MSMQPEWNFVDTVREKVKIESPESSPISTISTSPSITDSPRAKRSPPPKVIKDSKEKTPRKEAQAPVQADKKSTSLYEVIAPILLELKNQSRYQNCV